MVDLGPRNMAFIMYGRHQRNNLGRETIWQDECAGRTHEPLYAPLSPTAPGQVIVFVLANTTASEKNGTITMTRFGFVVYDISLTDFQTVVQIFIS